MAQIPIFNQPEPCRDIHVIIITRDNRRIKKLEMDKNATRYFAKIDKCKPPV